MRVAAPGAIVDAVIAFLRRGDDAVSADGRLAGAVAAEVAAAAIGARWERGRERAPEVCPAAAVPLAGVVGVAMGVAPLQVAGHAAQGAVALAAALGPVLRTEIALLPALPDAVATPRRTRIGSAAGAGAAAGAGEEQRCLDDFSRWLYAVRRGADIGCVTDGSHPVPISARRPWAFDRQAAAGLTVWQ